MIVELIKAYLVPGSATFLLIFATIGIAMAYGRERIARAGRILLTSLLILYWVMATPLVARALETILRDGYTPQELSDDISDIDALVILGGGSVTHSVDDTEINTLSTPSALRILEGLRLYPALDDPLVIVSGGINERVGRMTPESYPLRDALLEAGIPEDRILMESTSRNTYEQAVNLAPLLEANGIERFIMVTSETHMRRSMLVFEARGLNPVASTAPQRAEGQNLSRWGFLPDEEALDASRDGMREVMALVFYALSGRLTP